MELGEKLMMARHEAGLSQRQLCGEEITRNMLSQIEHGTAKPSMATLSYLASRLGKPVSYFLDEETVVSANQQVMTAARKAFDNGEYDAVMELLEDYRSPDEVYDRERDLMEHIALLALAERAAAEGREPYARELILREEGLSTSFFSEELKNRRLRLLGHLRGTKPEQVASQLPNLDGDLILRAAAALAQGQNIRAGCLLDAAEDHSVPQWLLLRGRAFFASRRWQQAVIYLQKAEAEYPAETAPLLERCFREMGDYKQAYYYATAGRSAKGE